MEKKDPLVAALIALCSREGDHRHVADKAKVSAENLWQIIKGIKLPSGNPRGVGPGLRVKLTAAYPDWLGSGVEPIDLDNNPEYPSIRRVRIKAQAGVTGYAVEYAGDDDGPPIVFRQDWFEMNGYRPDKMLALRVTGESMIPKLRQGDLIVVNTKQTTPKDGVVFVVNYEGEIVVKRLLRDAGKWWLTSDSEDQRRFPRKVCDDSTQIVGEVVYLQTAHI